ncbi:MAG: hypothetical protein ACPG8W_25345 [Candidatus Promineifilaceae bacterium]
MTQEEKANDISAASKNNSAKIKSKPKVISVPPDNNSASRQQLLIAAVIGVVMMIVLAFIFLPQQLNRDETDETTSADVTIDGVYDVIEMVGEQQWRESCATTMSKGVVIVQRSQGEAQACINRDIAVEMDDFSAEWEFTLNGGTALFLIGQNAQHYLAAIDQEASEIVLSVVEKDGAAVTDLRTRSIQLDADRPNKLMISRQADEISFVLNDAPLMTTDDMLYIGAPIELWMGVGGRATDEGEATITYQSMQLKTP